MKTFIVKQPGITGFEEVPVPEPDDFEALVKNELCVICNSTDTMIIDGSFPHSISYPCVLGHEVVGLNEALAAVKSGDVIKGIVWF